MARVQVDLAGGCLCGAVRYRVSGHEGNVPLCHCAHCRRQSGAPMVAWLEVARDDLSWTASEPRYYEHESDLAPVVRRAFCDRCGSSLTWERGGAPTIDVATGTLDDPAAAPAPTRHTWARRQLEWTVRDDGLPRDDRGGDPPGPPDAS